MKLLFLKPSPLGNSHHSRAQVFHSEKSKDQLLSGMKVDTPAINATHIRSAMDVWPVYGISMDLKQQLCGHKANSRASKLKLY